MHDRLTPRLFRWLAQAGATARRDAARIDVPVLLVVAADDALVDAGAAREFAAALAPGIGTLLVYDGLYHELFNERAADRERVLADVGDWIERTLQLAVATATRSGQACTTGHGSSSGAPASTRTPPPGRAPSGAASAHPPSGSAAASCAWKSPYVEAGRLREPGRPARRRGQQRSREMAHDACDARSDDRRGGVMRLLALP